MSDNRNHPAESAASPSILEIRSLQKAFSENAVLKDISLSVERGNVISIIGPSGSGKSTFLRSLNLLETPTSGSIIFEGTDITQKKGPDGKKLNIDLIDFKLEFGITSDGQLVLADEISPDTCRFWDSTTHEKLDKDRFRRDLGNVEEAYREMLKRLTHAE